MKSINVYGIGELVKVDDGFGGIIGKVERIRSYSDITEIAEVTATFYTVTTFKGTIDVPQEKVMKNYGN